MAKIDEGGPVFPGSGKLRPSWAGDSVAFEFQGLSVRDYFAAAAPLIPESVINDDPWTGNGHLQCLSAAEKQAWWGFQYADAMLKARESK